MEPFSSASATTYLSPLTTTSYTPSLGNCSSCCSSAWGLARRMPPRAAPITSRRIRAWSASATNLRRRRSGWRMSSVPYSTLVSDDSVLIFLSIVDAVTPLWSLCCRLPVLMTIHFQGFRFRLYTLPISALVHRRWVSLLDSLDAALALLELDLLDQNS